MAWPKCECEQRCTLRYQSNVHTNEIAIDEARKSAVVDVREASQVFAFTNDAVNEFSGLDIVVANAGVWTSTDPVEDSQEKLFLTGICSLIRILKVSFYRQGSNPSLSE